MFFQGCTHPRTHPNKPVCCVEETPYLVSINIVDRNGLSETISNPERLEQYANVDFLTPQPYDQVLRVFNRDSSGNIPALLSSYHPNGTPKQYLEVVNGRACGAYREWHPNGTQRISAQVIEGIGDLEENARRSWMFDGNSQVWNEQGVLIAEIPYIKGSQEGVAKYYHTDSTLWKVAPYQQNRIQGALEIYRRDGTLLQRSQYHQGQLEGESLRYWAGGPLAAEEQYTKGLLATGRYYDQNGGCLAKIDDGTGVRALFGKDQVAELHEYRDGVLEGEVKVLDASGRTSKSYHVKNGCKHGEELIYYSPKRLNITQTPKLSINWYEGKIQGTVKTWYENGALESQKEWSNNKKNGHSTAWYRDGTLMMIEEYDQDTLVRGEYYNKDNKLPISTVEESSGLCTLFDADGNFIQKVTYLHGKPQLD